MTIIKNNWNILLSESSYAHPFWELISFAIRRATSLMDRLIRNYPPDSKSKSFIKKLIGTFRCENRKYCHKIIRSIILLFIMLIIIMDN